MNLEVYLTFPGTCEEAMNFYKEIFGGEIQGIMLFRESEMEVPEDYKDKIMHSTLKTDDFMLMASDGMPGFQAPNSPNISLSLDVDSEEQQDKLFNMLSEGGQVQFPLQLTFWGSRFGMLKDKFGIVWMLSVAKN
jgi:PhnB protein